MEPYKGDDVTGPFRSWLDRLITELPRTGSFTLTASTTSTVVTDSRVNSGTVITVTPTTANAAAEFGTLYITAAAGQFTVTHSNTADNDKTFKYRI